MDKLYKCTCVGVVLAFLGTPLFSQGVSYSLYGTPGLIEMPTARSDTDAQFVISGTYFEQQSRIGLTFQVTPRLSGTFRYAGLDGLKTEGQALLDRNFDVRYRFWDETDTRPAVAIGLQDFLGAGVLSSEYVVATKGFGDNLDVSFGLGWGRLGSYKGFDNPLKSIHEGFRTRPNRQADFVGRQAFRGNAAFFAGAEYQYSPKLRFKAEYSSDAYALEQENGDFVHKTPFNFGVSYKWKDSLLASAALLHGSELAVSATFALNPKARWNGAGLDEAPQPVHVRPKNLARAKHWGTSEARLRESLLEEGVKLEAYDVRSDVVARIRYTNTRYRSEAQAMGRLVRILSAQIPAQVEEFVLEPMQKGVPLSRVVISRSDVELLEYRANGAQEMLARSRVEDAVSSLDGYTSIEDTERLSWGVGPYVARIAADDEGQTQLDAGVELSAQYVVAPNLVTQGRLRYSLRSRETFLEESEPQGEFHNVRGDARFYGQGLVLEDLTASYYDRPAQNIYSRVSVGYLEKMYGGLSSEVLWKPVDQNFAVGVEVNYVRQRAFDQRFDFQDYETVTGHVSGYYHFDNGFEGQVDVGRYLAGDWGATLSLNRAFDNGWKVGCYVTLTDMPFDRFGEGSFDRGVQISIPTDFFFGKPSRSSREFRLSPLSRDGGARVEVEGRLYDVVEGGHLAGGLGQTWGRFWK